ncbi:hypothetical protein Mapa_007554 [Marchantia paleacea]|nr:hypothetical protein Mapa_007554 [Marchantia paleacea]
MISNISHRLLNTTASRFDICCCVQNDINFPFHSELAYISASMPLHLPPWKRDSCCRINIRSPTGTNMLEGFLGNDDSTLKLNTQIPGIPQPYTPFKLKNGEFNTLLAVSTKNTETPIVEDTDINTLDVYWYLVSSEKREASYNIISLKNGLALTGHKSSSGEHEVLMQTLEEFSEKQLWAFVATKMFSDGLYRVQNYSTKVDLQTTAVDEGNTVTTIATGDGPESFNLQWRFKFSEGVRQGIPPPSKPFRIMNHEHKRFVFSEDKVLFLRDTVNSLRELQFRLVVPKLKEMRETYLIESLLTNMYVTDDGVAKGEAEGVQLGEKDEEDLRQYWIVVPSKEFDGGFRLRNAKTKGYLLNGPTHAGNQLSSLGSIKEWPDQVCIFSLVLPALEHILSWMNSFMSLNNGVIFNRCANLHYLVYS